MAHPGGHNENQNPAPWKPGSGEAPNVNQSGLPEEEGVEPTGLGKDPVYPPILGYEGTGFREARNFAPPPAPVQPQGEPPPVTFTDLAKLDEEGCRLAMVQHVAEHCCYGSKPAKNMQITKHEGVTALHLELESFGEGRKTKSKREPYKGGTVDGPENGPAPAAWAIPVPPDSMFKTHKIKKEVPHTSVVRSCAECDAKGWNTCWKCHGRGKNKCFLCAGRGFTYITRDGQRRRRDCGACVRGYSRCWTCGGDGKITCRECQGYRNLRCYIQLIVTFTNHKDDYILETTDMPDDLIRDVGGTPIFQDVKPLVWPIISYPVKEINDNSGRLLNEHRGKWPNERIINQRQTLRGVPVTEVAYTWDDVKTRFWVYGNERKVYAPDYPHQCCCGCSII